MSRHWPQITLPNKYKFVLDTHTGLIACHCPYHGNDCAIHRNAKFVPIGFFLAWMQVDFPAGPAWAHVHKMERKHREDGQTMGYARRRFWFDWAREQDRC